MRGDVKLLSQQLWEHIEAGHASTQLMASWRRHIDVVQGLDDTGITLDNGACQWQQDLKARLGREFGEVELEYVGSLGRDVAAATFVADGRLRIVLGQDAFLSDDALEAQFRAYHMYLHGRGGLPRTGYACWLDYKRDVEAPALIPILKNAKYRQDEAYLNDTAAALMYDDYVATRLLINPDPSLLRGALPWADGMRLTTLYRALAGPPVLGDERLIPLIYWTVRRSLASLVRPKLNFEGSVAIVRRHWWSPIYLVWKDAAGQPWRRWIPSRHVLYALGLRLGDVEDISEPKLQEFQYDGILIDPAEVRRIRAVLAQSASTRHRSLRYLRRVVPSGLRLWHLGPRKNMSTATFSRNPAVVTRVA